MTKTTPYVHLDTASRTFLISGRSIPIDAELFYNPILHWFDRVIAEGQLRSMQFVFRFDFFNIATSKRILFLLYKLAELQRSGCHVMVRWVYEQYDKDMLEIGQDYAIMVDQLSFKFESFDATTLRIKKTLKTG